MQQLIALRAGKHPRTNACLGAPCPEPRWDALAEDAAAPLPCRGLRSASLSSDALRTAAPLACAPRRRWLLPLCDPGPLSCSLLARLGWLELARCTLLMPGVLPSSRACGPGLLVLTALSTPLLPPWPLLWNYHGSPVPAMRAAPMWCRLPCVWMRC